MKICGLKSHPEYRPDYSLYEVRVDGQLVIDCVFADDEKDWAIHLIRDPDKNIILSNAANTGPKLAELRGKVYIRRTSRPLNERYSEAFLNLFTANKTPLIRPH